MSPNRFAQSITFSSRSGIRNEKSNYYYVNIEIADMRPLRQTRERFSLVLSRSFRIWAACPRTRMPLRDLFRLKAVQRVMPLRKFSWASQKWNRPWLLHTSSRLETGHRSESILLNPFGHRQPTVNPTERIDQFSMSTFTKTPLSASKMRSSFGLEFVNT